MLYLSRRIGEAVIINNAIEVRIVEVKGKSVKLGFVFPAEASVLREELFLELRAANEAAAAAAASLPDDLMVQPEPQSGAKPEKSESEP